MFLIFIALIIVFITGYSVSVFFLADRVKKIEIMLISLVAGLMIMGYFILFASALTGSFAAAVRLFMALGGIYSFYVVSGFWRFKRKIDYKKINSVFLIGKLRGIPWLEAIFFILFIVFFFDIFSKTIIYQDGAYKAAVAGYGDIPFHMAQASYFIYNTPFALEEPIYSGVKLVYAFLINLLSAAFYVLSGNYILSFNLPSYILLFAGFFFIYRFISVFIKTALMRISAFLVFFLGTGSGFVKIFQDSAFWARSGIMEMADYILHLPYRIVNFYDAVYPAQNNIWSGFMTMFLMHQRSFFFGFAAGAMILYLLSIALKINDGDKKIFYFIGLSIGFLPLVHMHTFIAILVITLGFCMWKIFIKEKVLAKNLAVMTLIGSALGSILSYIFIFNSGASEKLLAFRLGWMSEPGIGAIQYNPEGGSPLLAWISYLWENFGLFFPLLAIAMIYFIIRKNNFLRQKNSVFGLMLGAIFIFIVVNAVKFQPWDYDNGKIFGYFLLLGSVIILYFFEQWKFRFGKIIAVIWVFPLISVGLIDAFSRSSLANPPLYEIFGAKERDAADWIVNNTLSNEVILTGTSHLNPVNSLAGRPVLAGYPGWLWSHGIDYAARERDIAGIYSGGINAKELLKKYNIQYIFIGPAERSMPNFNERFFSENYPAVFQEREIRIYKVNLL